MSQKYFHVIDILIWQHRTKVLHELGEYLLLVPRVPIELLKTLYCLFKIDPGAFNDEFQTIRM